MFARTNSSRQALRDTPKRIAAAAPVAAPRIAAFMIMLINWSFLS
jgi:hypothetical protein